MARYDPEKHHRRSVRLKGYNYAWAGAYFVTICTWGRECLFGDVVDGTMRLSELGQIAGAVWEELPQHYSGLELDAFVTMPNHVHGIIVLTGGDGFVGAGPVGAGLKPAPTPPAPTPHPYHGMSEIVRGFKTFSARRINVFRDTQSASVWQRGFYEHIIRNERELNAIRQYIVDNPAQWAVDRENPQRRA